MKAAKFSMSLRTRLAVLFGFMSLLVGLPTYLYISSIHHDQLIVDRRHALDALAISAATVLSENLVERRREIELLAQTPLYRQAPLDSSEFRASLERLKLSYPHYSWIGLADVDGKVRAATSNHLLGVDVSSRPWFSHGQKGVFVGDVHEAVLLAKLLPRENPGQVLRFIDFASPVLDDAGNLRGVLAAHAHWRWAETMLNVVLPHDADASGLDIFIVNADNQIIYPESPNIRLKPPTRDDLRGAAGNSFQNWGDGGEYLTSSAAIKEPVIDGTLGWRVLVRQSKEVVISNVSSLQHAVLKATSVAAILLLILVWIGAEGMSRPVRRLTEAARKIEHGREDVEFEAQAGSDELLQLSEALRSMASTLLQQKHELEVSNQTLEAKVAARTEELNLLNQKLDLLARTDALTALPNRLQANERLHQEFLRLGRSHDRYVLFLMDIDFFKRVNDNYGHATGDAVLRHVSALIQRSIRKTDFVARVGGEEFMVILPSTPLAQALNVAEKIRHAVESSAIEPVGTISISIGVHEASSEDRDENEALRVADEWLYKAKALGRNRVMSVLTQV